MLVSGTTTSDLEVLLHYAKRHDVNVYTYGDLIEAHKYSRLRSSKVLTAALKSFPRTLMRSSALIRTPRVLILRIWLATTDDQRNTNKRISKISLAR
mmetsp:Transcript_15801/g.64550  ORF Transcript_15801/g.64550 Transcript_15801/m.64550 type:complete len:97 (-) Transcript_15801:267-557(-)